MVISHEYTKLRKIKTNRSIATWLLQKSLLALKAKLQRGQDKSRQRLAWPEARAVG